MLGLAKPHKEPRMFWSGSHRQVSWNVPGCRYRSSSARFRWLGCAAPSKMLWFASMGNQSRAVTSPNHSRGWRDKRCQNGLQFTLSQFVGDHFSWASCEIVRLSVQCQEHCMVSRARLGQSRPQTSPCYGRLDHECFAMKWWCLSIANSKMKNTIWSAWNDAPLDVTRMKTTLTLQGHMNKRAMSLA